MRSTRALLHVREATLIVALVFGCTRAPGPASSSAMRPPTVADSAAARERRTPVTKRVAFAMLEDYDKGEDLGEVARDFALMRELGITTWRGSFGWDDYEPERGEYDFAWLRRFADLAAREGITLRPYIGYTPEWAGGGGSDGDAWNDPPRRVDDWYRFVDTLAAALRDHPAIASYEIYNEENVPQWWDGTAAQYNAVLARGAAAVRHAVPDAQVIFGGMVWPDADFVEAACVTHHNASAFDVLPFHAYPETWTPDSVTVENYLGPGFDSSFVPLVDSACGGKPIWINETGFATVPGKTEAQQAEWWARAIATFAAEPRVVHIGVYEIKDLRPDSPVIGDQPNYHLGITRVDRTPKAAFAAVRLLVSLVGGDSITVADDELRVTASSGQADSVYRHLFVRRDGRQVVFVWTRGAPAMVDLRLTRRGSSAVEYGLDGSSRTYAPFDGVVLPAVRLEPGHVRIFEIRP